MNVKRFCLCAIVFAASAVLVLPSLVFSASQAESFSLSGSGSLLANPAEFNGIIDAGTLAGGTFVINIDDSGWPTDDPMTPQNERWDYLLSNYYTYSPTTNNEHWTGYFPLYGGVVPPVLWHFYNGGNNLGGIIRYLIITISDDDKDGIVDQSELMNQAVAGNLQSHIEQSTGSYFGMCGIGSMNGNLQDFDPTLFDLLTIPIGNLYLRTVSCAVPAENPSWGAVKAMYAD